MYMCMASYDYMHSYHLSFISHVSVHVCFTIMMKNINSRVPSLSSDYSYIQTKEAHEPNLATYVAILFKISMIIYIQLTLAQET